MRDNSKANSVVNQVDAAMTGRPRTRVVGLFGLMLMVVFAVVAAGQISVQAQQISSAPLRLTVQTGVAGCASNTVNLVNTDTNDTRTIELSVDFSGVAGVLSAVFADPVVVIPARVPDPDGEGPLGGTNGTANTTLTVCYDGSVPQIGAGEIIIFATNTTAASAWNFRLPLPFKSAVFWEGGTNNISFGTATNWQANTVPIAGDVALFGTVVLSTNVSVPGVTLTNVVYTNATPITNVITLTNVIVSADTPALGGLRFGQETNAYDVEIKPNVTVLVTGTEGFQMLGDDAGDDSPVTLFGGGNLVISNSAAPFAIYSSGDNLDMSGLGSLVANVNRICLDNFSCYPNLYTNGTYNPNGGYGAGADVYLARSNYIKTAWIGGEAVITNNGEAYFPRPYAFSVGVPGRTSGSSLLAFGLTNVLCAESILFSGGGNNSQDDKIFFSTDTNVIASNSIPALYIRGAQETNRVAVLTMGDNSGQSQLNQHSKVWVNLGNGKVDAKIDKLYVGRDRWNCGDNDAMTVDFSLGGTNAAGTIVDVNTVYLSMQELGTNHASAEELADDADPRGEVRGTLRVGANAVFKVNNTMHIGYTTAPAEDATRKAAEGYGSVYISDGGVVLVNDVQVGGITKASGSHSVFNHRPYVEQNGFILTGGGELVVSNQLGYSDKWLNGLTMSDSTLTLHVDGNKADVYGYFKEIVTGGAGNTIRLGSIANISTFPTTVKLLAYESASPNFGVTMPPGYFGFIVNNTVDSTIDVVINNFPPANLVWNGAPGTDWDTSAANWQGGAVFTNGDTCRFDDTASNPSVSVGGTVYVGGAGVLITNNALTFTMGGGTIGGTVPMNKWGTNSLAVNASSQLPLTIHEGAVTGNGSLGSTIVKSNTTLNFGGAITRLVSSGAATLSSGATVPNGATISGGTLVNSGVINGVVQVTGSSAMTVTPGGGGQIALPSTSEINGTNASLVLNGRWTNGILNGPDGIYRIDVTGTLTGTGSILTGKPELTHGSGTAPAYWSRLVLGSGGVLSPGAAPGNIIVFTNQSQLDFSTGSTIILDVNMDSAPGSAVIKNAATGSTLAKSSDQIYTSRWSTRTGTLKMNRLGATPWTNGTVLKVLAKPIEQAGGGFRNRVFDGVANQMPSMSPASPGLGLLWNLDDFATNGVITIVGTASTPPTLVAMPMPGATNVITFSWPTNYQGWQLQSQANALTNGLGTNWTVVTTVSSWTNTSLTITNWISKELELKVYRMAHPAF